MRRPRTKSSEDIQGAGPWQHWEGVAAGTEGGLSVCQAFYMHHLPGFPHRLCEAGTTAQRKSLRSEGSNTCLTRTQVPGPATRVQAPAQSGRPRKRNRGEIQLLFLNWKEKRRHRGVGGGVGGRRQDILSRKEEVLRGLQSEQVLF